MTTQPFSFSTTTRIGAPDGLDRVAVIDALRGFALAGIIVAHCAGQYFAGPTPPSAGTLNLFSPLDFTLSEVAGYTTLANSSPFSPFCLG